MDRKITFKILTSALAEKTSMPEAEVATMLKSLFAASAEALTQGNEVVIPNVGIFRLLKVESRMSVDVTTGQRIEIPAHNRISFEPDSKLAEQANFPFSAFSAETLSDDVSIEDLAAADGTDYILDTTPEEPEDLPVAETSIESETQETPASIMPPMEETLWIPDDEEGEIEAEEPVQVTTEEDVPDVDEAKEVKEPEAPAIAPYIEESKREETVVETEETDYEEPHVRKSRFGWGFVSGFIAAAAMCGIAFFLWFWYTQDERNPELPVNSGLSATTASEIKEIKKSAGDLVKIQPNDEKPYEAVNAAPTTPSDEVVYDTISHTRYLTTMAKDHYGNYHLWPYIYEKNSKILGHPDRIKPGTRVVIPNLSEYGVDPKSDKDIAAAKAKGVAIYARYK